MGIGILYVICGAVILVGYLVFGVNILNNTLLTIIISLGGIALGIWYIRKAVVKKKSIGGDNDHK